MVARGRLRSSGRLKPNGQLTGYSPLSRLVELEGLSLGITGKLGLWRALLGLVPGEPRLDGAAQPSRERALRQRDERGGPPRCEPRDPGAFRAQRPGTLPPPMSWEPELEELRRREELARRMGGEERVERQHASGRLTVRERSTGSSTRARFHETGALAGRATTATTARSWTSCPPTSSWARGGSTAGAWWCRATTSRCAAAPPTRRSGRSRSTPSGWRSDLRLPLVRLVDGTGGGGSVKSLEDMGFSYVPPLPGFDVVVANLATVPGGRRGARPGGRPRRRARGRARTSR